MTGYENDCLKHLSREIRTMDGRIIRVETKVDDAAEAREVARDQMESMGGRMNLLLGLIVTMLITMLPTLGVLTYQVTQLSHDVEANRVSIEEKVDRAIEMEKAD